MKTKVVRHTFALLLLAAMSFAAEQTYDFSPAGRFILHGPSSRKIFDQCSRAAPPSTSELWEPSGKDIDDLEVLLAKYLTERDKAGKTTPPKGTKYHRQYTGFVQNGERFIYGNFYPAGEGFRRYESRRPVQVCDGGHVFWGIVYRVKTKTFEELAFNGFA
jgi:hypothetical protein